MFIHYQNNFKIINLREVNSFIRKILEIGESYLKFLLSRNKIYLPEYLDPKDASVDLLAEIFTCVDSEFIKIKHFFDNNFTKGEIKNEVDFELYLRGFIYSVIQNNLPNLYKNTDPFFHNIYRNIKESVKSLNYNVSIHFSDKYIHSEKDVNFNLYSPEKEDIIQLVYKNELNRNVYSIPVFLKSLFDILNKESRLCPAISFYDLVSVVKSILSSEFLYQNGNSSENVDISDRINIKFILEDVKYSFTEKLSKYVLKNDLSQNFFDCMYNIIEEIISDYSFGNERTSVMDLMKTHFKSSEKYLFYKVQYCIELFETEIARNIKKENILIGR